MLRSPALGTTIQIRCTAAAPNQAAAAAAMAIAITTVPAAVAVAVEWIWIINLFLLIHEKHYLFFSDKYTIIAFCTCILFSA